MSSWRHVSTSAVGGASVRILFNADEGIYRATLEPDVTDVGTTQSDARQRLAAKLELMARALRG